METFSALLAICAGNSPVTGEFTAQWPVTRNFDVFFDLCLNKRLGQRSWGWWFETQLRSLWRHRNEYKFSAGEIPFRVEVVFTVHNSTWLVICTAPGHYLGQWWLFNWTLGNKQQLNFNQSLTFSVKKMHLQMQFVECHSFCSGLKYINSRNEKLL